MLDFSVQAVQAPLRALLTDIFTGEALTRGNAMLALYIGLGNLIGGALTGAHLSRFLPLSDVQAVFAFAACILLLSSCISSFYTTEPSVLHIKQPPSFVAQILAHAPDKGSKSVRTRIWNVLCALPHPFWPIFMIQLCTWCGFFTLFVFTNAWVGINIFGGVGGEQGLKGELFRTGVRLGGVGNAAMAIVTMLYSLMMPRLLRSFGTRRVYMFSQAVEATCLLSAYFIRGSPGTHPSRLLRALTVTNLGAFGVVWATTVTVPWTLIGNALERDERYRQQIGLFTTLFNASQCIPQFVVAFVAAGVMRLVNDCAVVMALGGVAAAVGIVLIPWFGVGEDRGKRRAKQRDVPAVDCEDG